MITWNNLDTLESYKELSNVKKVNIPAVSGFILNLFDYNIKWG